MWWCILEAVLTARVIVQQLTDFLWIGDVGHAYVINAAKAARIPNAEQRLVYLSVSTSVLSECGHI